jgi:hypothetical protein
VAPVDLTLVERWTFPVLWILVPFTAGPALADALDPRTQIFRTATSVGLWLGWAAVLGAALVPRTVTLTAIRLVTPAALAGVVWAAAVTPHPGLADGVALAFLAATTAVALAPGTGDAFVNGSAYGHERRFPLRAPAALLLGPIELGWVVAVAGAVTGPLLLAAGRWIAGGLALGVGWPAALLAVRMLHGLSRRWLVFTPAGVVVHDQMVVIEAMLVLRRHVASIGPARAGSAGGDAARDLSLGAPGVPLVLDLTEPYPITPRPTRRPGQPAPAIESVEVSAVLVTPTRPGRVLTEAATRGLAVGVS